MRGALEHLGALWSPTLADCRMPPAASFGAGYKLRPQELERLLDQLDPGNTGGWWMTVVCVCVWTGRERVVGCVLRGGPALPQRSAALSLLNQPAKSIHRQGGQARDGRLSD